MTRNEVSTLIIAAEANREFDKHIDPINFDTVIKVDEHYRYTNKSFFERVKLFLENLFIVRPYTFYLNKFIYKTRVVGKENLIGLKSAVVTCNHFMKFDCLIAKGAIGQKLKITAAPFNNQKGFLGEMMRAGGMLPMAENISGIKNFNKAIAAFLEKKKYILFYPEASMWWNYKKPRPHKEGGYYFAAKLKKPVLPMFITMKENGKKDENGFDKYHYTLNIGKPVFPSPELNIRENIEYMREQCEEFSKNVYERFYNTKLVY